MPILSFLKMLFCTRGLVLSLSFSQVFCRPSGTEEMEEHCEFELWGHGGYSQQYYVLHCVLSDFLSRLLAFSFLLYAQGGEENCISQGSVQWSAPSLLPCQ